MLNGRGVGEDGVGICLRERPEIGGKRVSKTQRSVSERAIREFELGCEWWKRETEVIG